VYEPLTSLPTPAPDHDSAPFWDGCRENRLLLQRCTSCGRFRYPPRPVCPFCRSFEAEWTQASGRGRLYSWTVAHHPVHPALKDRVPYTLLLVELEEGPRMVSVLAQDGAPTDLAAGEPLEAVFLSVDDETVLPYFRRPDQEA
jgi:uncharacterized OB-fold protein